MRNEAKLSYDIRLNLPKMMGLSMGMMNSPPRRAWLLGARTIGVIAAISNYVIMLQGCSLILGTIAVPSLTSKPFELILKNLTAWLRMVIWREI